MTSARILWLVVSALGVGALGTVVYVGHSTDERGADGVAGSFACPDGMTPISGSRDLPAFCVDPRDATNAEVAACRAAGACGTPKPESACEPVETAPPDEPATCVDYPLLHDYCAYAGKRANLDELDRASSVLGGGVHVRCTLDPGGDPPGTIPRAEARRFLDTLRLLAAGPDEPAALAMACADAPSCAGACAEGLRNYARVDHEARVTALLMDCHEAAEEILTGPADRGPEPSVAQIDALVASYVRGRVIAFAVRARAALGR